MHRKNHHPDLLRIITLVLCFLIILYIWLFLFMPRRIPNSFRILVPSSRMNILVMGLDYSYNDQHFVSGTHRTDSLMLVSIDPFSNKLTLLSIPRDTFAEIPGRGMNKINSAYAFGKEDLTLQTVRIFLGINDIDKYVVLDPDGFIGLVDALGGIKVFVDKDMDYKDSWGHLDIHLKKGWQKLKGKEAQGFVRFRHEPLGDISRVERQRNFLKVVFNKLSTPSALVRSPWLYSSVSRSIRTNLSFKDILKIGNFVRSVKSGDIVSETLPGNFSSDKATQGDWIPDNQAKYLLLEKMKIK